MHVVCTSVHGRMYIHVAIGSLILLHTISCVFLPYVYTATIPQVTRMFPRRSVTLTWLGSTAALRRTTRMTMFLPLSPRDPRTPWTTPPGESRRTAMRRDRACHLLHRLTANLRVSPSYYMYNCSSYVGFQYRATLQPSLFPGSIPAFQSCMLKWKSHTCTVWSLSSVKSLIYIVRDRFA